VRASLAAGALGLLALAACGGGDDTPAAPLATGLALAVGPPAAAQVGEPLSPAPVVQVLGAGGQPLARLGVPVGAAIAGGPGALSGTTTRLTDASGRAAFAGLAFSGLAAGTRSLVFSAPGLAAVASAELQVSPGPPARLEAASPVDQTAAAGGPVADPPAVRLADAGGNPIPGARVDFAVTAGGGSVTGSPAVTGAGGVATAGSWILGPSGSQALQATSPALAGAAVIFSATARAPAAAYDITLRFVSPVSDAQRLAFGQAQARIEQVITGDLPDVPVSVAAGACGNPTALSETVDDLLILAEVVDIDGPGGILAQAGPCLIRSGSLLPLLGEMQFDQADLQALEARGQLTSVVLHEMLHVVGFGTIWPNLGLVSGAGGADPVFVGSGARDAFLNFNGGAAYPGTPVPVENTGGAGTRDSHWREAVFASELMTGFISGASQPLSRTTAMSLQDMGYAVDPAAADPFDLSTALRSRAAAPGEMPLGEVLLGPVLEVDERGVARPAGR
jgi:hypothetical protein